jgi:predicted PurR-regulated permease PerM
VPEGFLSENKGRDLSQWVLLAGITLIALYLTWLIVSPFVDVIVWAVVLVIVFHPLHETVLRRTRRPGLSALLAVAAAVVLVVAPILLVGSAAVRQLSSTAASAQSSLQNLVAHPYDNVWVQKFTGIAGRYVDLGQGLSRENLQGIAAKVSQVLLQGTVGVVGGAVGFVAKLFFVLFTMFYLFRDAPQAVSRLQALLPMSPARSSALLHQIREVINASVYGVVAIAMLQGALGGLMLWFLGVPSSLLLGVMMGLFSMVPVVGGALIWVPTVLVLLIAGHTVSAIVLAVWCVLVVGAVDNFLRPKLVGGRTQMHDLAIFFSVLGGVQVFGMMGLLLGPVVFAITMALLTAFREAPGAEPER